MKGSGNTKDLGLCCLEETLRRGAIVERNAGRKLYRMRKHLVGTGYGRCFGEDASESGLNRKNFPGSRETRKGVLEPRSRAHFEGEGID